ncbi:MAG TPA: tyrosine-type recombinase/integrase [Flavipsychrobacter sp.]|nr:tyrosine-type recombinase/integrase [Flavipsychrobacter sp.]
MKILPITTPQYAYLEKGFAEWLDVLGYSDMTIYNMPHVIREFLHYQENRGIKEIRNLKQQHIKSYHDHICSRSNQRRGGGLSDKYIVMHLQAIEKFLEYLRHCNIPTLARTGIRLLTPARKQVTVLTVEEIRLLFHTTRKDILIPAGSVLNLSYYEAMQARDRALLVIYYSCGLRRNEGVHIHTDDINFDNRLLHVRKGKNYKERFVPFNKTNAQYLQEYIYDHRPLLLKEKNEPRLFISQGARQMTGGSLNNRLQLLQRQTEDIPLQEKELTLHTLRHSIATHLLQAGMPFEKIARFLGHQTLDSTQIYAHLLNAHD